MRNRDPSNTIQAPTRPDAGVHIIPDALQIRDHSPGTLWRSAIIAKEVMSHSAAGA